MNQEKNYQNKVAVLILVMFTSLSFLWSVFTPVFEGPDEDSAYNYSRYYARTWELPNINKRPMAEGVFHWEPLYFILSGRIAELTKAPASASGNYYYADGWRRIREDNPSNLFKHQPGEFWFDWDEIAWSLHLMRLLSVFLATGSVWLTYKFSREIFSKSSWAPHIVMMLFAFNPQFIFFSGILNVVNMVTFMATLFMYLLIIYIRRDDNRWYHSAVLGAVLGTAMLSKMTALMMFPIALATVILKHRGSKKFVITLMAFLLAFLATGGWYLIRNQALYGEFSGARAHVLFRFNRIVNPFLEEVGILNYLISYPKTQWTTLWSGFGWITVYLPSIFPFVTLLVYAHGVVGFVQGVLFNKLKLTKGQRSQLIAMSLIPLLVWLGITRAIFYVEVFHGKDLFLITGALSLIVVTGWRGLLEDMKSDNWIKGKTKMMVVGLMGVLTAFWFRQFEMAKLAKGIARWSDVWQLISSALLGALAILICWRLINYWLTVIKSRKYRIDGSGNLFVVFVAAVFIVNLGVLFLLFIPRMYGISLRELVFLYK